MRGPRASEYRIVSSIDTRYFHSDTSKNIGWPARDTIWEYRDIYHDISKFRYSISNTAVGEACRHEGRDCAQCRHSSHNLPRREQKNSSDETGSVLFALQSRGTTSWKAHAELDWPELWRHARISLPPIGSLIKNTVQKPLHLGTNAPAHFLGEI